MEIKTIEEMPAQVEVNNLAGKAIYRSWTLGLMDTEMRKQWEAYKADQEKRATQLELHTLTRIPLPIRIKNWATAAGYGVDPNQKALREGTLVSLPANYEPETKFELQDGKTILSGDQAKELWSLRVRHVTQKIKYGESEPSVHKEGYIVFSTVEDKPEPNKYGDMSYPELQAEVKRRGLNASGKSSELRVKLVQDDLQGVG